MGHSIGIGKKCVCLCVVCFFRLRVTRRDNWVKVDIPMGGLVKVKGLLDDVQESMFNVDKQKRDMRVEVTKTCYELLKL